MIQSISDSLVDNASLTLLGIVECEIKRVITNFRNNAFKRTAKSIAKLLRVSPMMACASLAHNYENGKRGKALKLAL